MSNNVPSSSSSSTSSSSSSQYTYSNGTYFPTPFHLQQQQQQQPYIGAAPPPPVQQLSAPYVYPAPAPIPGVYTLPQFQQAQQLFQRDAQTITLEALETVKAALASSEIEHKAEAKKKAIPRKAAGLSWEDPTLAEWPENDCRLFCAGSLIHALRKLTEAPYLETVDWTKWHVFWVDERVVPKDHEDSNYKLALDGFLSKVPIPTGQVYAINDALSAEGAAEDYETILKQLVKNGVLAMSKTTGFPRFDLQLLGMGPDGHIASLFPGHPLVKENKKWVTHILDSPKPPPQRITFTFPVINSSAYVAMVVTGAGKAGAVQKAISDKKTSDLLPVEMAVLDDGEFTWFTDKEAVSMLQN